MKVLSDLFTRVLCAVLVLALINIPEMASAQQQSVNTDAEQSSSEAASATTPAQPASLSENTSQPAQPKSSELPNSPGALRAQATPPQSPQSEQQQQQRTTERPLGTAAAEIGNASGTAASKPAGVAIAPAKQRQSRSLLLKWGAVLGAGAAIGTVMALSAGSPSRPPGAP
jgi:hypothetical protein